MAQTVHPPRSGCAVVAGVFLVAVGSIFLAYNVSSYLGVSPLRASTRALVWFGTYWPLFFIAWGLYKLYERRAHPGRSFATATEIVILAWILVGGLAINGAQRAMEELAFEVSVDDFAGVLGPDVLGPVHRFVETETFELGGATTLIVENERGEVVIVGSDEPAIEATMTKQIYSFSDTDAESAASRASLEIEATGDEARLFTARPEGRARVLMNLELRVPRTVSVRVDNGRGLVRVADVAAPVVVTTTHGDIEARNLSSGIDARTSRAAIRIDNVSGTTNARNRHGEIYASSIEGDLRAETENGSVTAEAVSGEATLTTRLGRVRASGITADVDVRARQSEISVERVGGSVTIASNSRPVFVNDVAGNVDVVTRNASVMVRAVGGDVSVENRYRTVSIADVRGKADVKGQQCAVDVDGVDGDLSIESSHEDVRISDFGSALAVRSTHADIDVTGPRLSGSVRIDTTYGDVSVQLAEGASAQVDAVTRDGKLTSDFPTLVQSGGEPNRPRWGGRLGSGTHAVTIDTSYGDITVSRLSQSSISSGVRP